jgi:predicted RNA-binding protein (TIGR00451 family)
MIWTTLSKSELFAHLTGIFSYQFGPTIVPFFEKHFDNLKFVYSRKTGKIKQIEFQSQIFANYKPTTGTFSLSIAGGKYILPLIPSPKARVIVRTDVGEFISQGKSVFTKHVVTVDPDLRVGDEVFVVDEADQLLAIGKLNVPVPYISQLDSGMAVRVRHGLQKATIEEQ